MSVFYLKIYFVFFFQLIFNFLKVENVSWDLLYFDLFVCDTKG